MPSGIYEIEGRAIGAPPVTKICARCAVEFQCKAAHTGRRRFCSKACQYAAKSERVAEIRKCPNCGNDFSIPRYKDTKYCSRECANKGTAKGKRTWYITGGGYVATGITVDGKQKTLMQHRHVMEKILARPLKEFENVHHKNGVRSDNRPENLEVWITKQPKGQRPEDLIEWAIAILEHHGYKVSAV